MLNVSRMINAQGRDVFLGDFIKNVFQFWLTFEHLWNDLFQYCGDDKHN